MEDVHYYQGKYRVKVVTQSAGYWIVEALEDFEDNIDGEKVKVKAGERRIVPSDMVHKREYLAPPVKEHAYELRMEKRLKKLLDEKERNLDRQR